MANEPFAVIRPPSDQTYHCPTCNQRVKGVAIWQDADHGHVDPCGCSITPKQMQDLLK